MKIHLFKNGSSVLIDEKSGVTVMENGEDFTQELEATEDNMKKHKLKVVKISKKL